MGKQQGFPWKRFQKSVLLVAAGIVLMVAGNAVSGGQTQMPSSQPSQPETSGGSIVPGLNSSTETDQSPDALEAEIEELLCAISGVKKATVVITYETSGEKIVEKDVTSESNVTREEDGAGGEREVNSGKQQEETIYVEDANGNRYPFIRTESYGTVRGVAVVVSGTYDESIREKIVRTLEVLLGVPTHKIQVIW